ncbi:NAD(P)-binding protein [Punctularia strigosozonata HHB-11173 SS5]|uniref:NAD(P)-binding protein n=1 Tax=Punctularia strigosozonata (strain HHB-11173) TaxID=741275 RepID=UPI0004416887|nr:NAD(P)-binding protein [Punctularia strigosozonata HHB-11173 SS5]EIN10843.1 NAD(P)-binding protein [Punctularia strigosozonata HHB-11173 SS5]
MLANTALNPLPIAVAKASLAEGASVTICSSSASRLEAAVGRLGGGPNVRVEVIDVTSETSVQSAFNKIGAFDHLVYTAVGEMGDGFDRRALEEYIPVMDIFFWGMVRCVKHAKAFVKESIITTAGTGAHKPMPGGFAITCAMGGAIVASSRCFALDYAPIRVNCVTPGLVDTERWDNNPATAMFKGSIFEHAKNTLPVKHVGTPEEVAETYLFLMKCGYMTGQSVSPDGGSLIL